MSRIGKKPIPIPAGVSITVEGSTVTVKGPKGQMKRTFRPEFINRIDEIIIFEPLSEEDVIEIVDLQMKEVRERMAEYNLQIELTLAAKKWLAHQGYDQDFGARPLKRFLQRQIETQLARALVEGKVVEGSDVTFQVKDDQLVMT